MLLGNNNSDEQFKNMAPSDVNSPFLDCCYPIGWRLFFTIMAKRFIDTEIFNDPWFMDLSVNSKLLFFYMITNCNHAGIIDMNWKLIEFQTKIKLLTKSYNTLIKELGNRIIRLSNDYYFIPKFIDFQYPGFPKSKVRQQEGAIRLLKEFDLWNEEKLTLNKELNNSYGNDSDNDNDSVNGSSSSSSGSILIKEAQKKFIPPTLEEMKAYFRENKYKEETAIKAWNYYNVADWYDAEGKKIKSWKQKCISVWFRDENKIKPKFVI